MKTPRLLVAAFFTLVFPVSLFAQTPDTTEKVVAGRANSAAQQEKAYVILISIDGMRHDFAEKFQAKNLLALSNRGVRAKFMYPSYPSLTFPNHYTLITGLYPAHHGLVDNAFYGRNEARPYSMGNRTNVTDPVWYGGVPLWVLAEQQNMLTASFYWVGSETKIDSLYPTHYYNYSTAIPIDQRVEKVKEWLSLPADQRPHLITFYFPEVDHEAHVHGPDSKEAGEAVHFVDESIGKLVKKVGETGLPVNFIVVSDHGMTKVDNEHAMGVPAEVDTTKFTIPRGDALLQLYAKNEKDIRPTYKALKENARYFDVYLRRNMPSRWHYGKKDDRYNRIGDIILVPHLPYVFNTSPKKTTPGKHGFDPQIPDMHAVFYAWGPAFRSGLVTSEFENVNVYPLVAHILGLPFTQKIDGKLEVLQNTLKDSEK
ncbi:MAG: alkaline phosphatase family protein [Mucilaginibacter polytrichastri]|nr:alkaline phosphatase family protein [Mucilaginibacter polytrichastri]